MSSFWESGCGQNEDSKRKQRDEGCGHPWVCPCGFWSPPGWWHSGADTEGGQASHSPGAATGTGLRRAVSRDFGSGFMLSWVQLSQQGTRLPKLQGRASRVTWGCLRYPRFLPEVLFCSVTELSFFFMELNSLVQPQDSRLAFILSLYIVTTSWALANIWACNPSFESVLSHSPSSGWGGIS